MATPSDPAAGRSPPAAAARPATRAGASGTASAARQRFGLDGRTRHLVGRLWRDHVRGHWATLVLATLAMAVVAAGSGAYPLLIKWTFDLLQAKAPQVLWLIPPLAVAVALLRGTATYFQQVLTSGVVLRVLVDLQQAMYAHLVSDDLARFARETPGALISRFTNDMNFIRDAMAKVLAGFIQHPLTVVANLAVMLYLDWVLAAVVLGVYPIAAIPIVRIGKKLRRHSTRVQEHAGDVTDLLDESFAGIRLIKTYGLETYQTGRAHGRLEELFRRNMIIVRTRGLIDPLLEGVGGIAIAGVLAFTGWRVISGTGTIGDLTGFITALLIAAPSVRALGTMNASLQEGLAAVQRVFTLLDTPPSVADRPDAVPLRVTAGQVRFRSVEFGYSADDPGAANPGAANPDAANPGAANQGTANQGAANAGSVTGPSAIRDLTLDIPAGQTVALVGPSGAGKSTILNLIPRLFDVRAGTIDIDGQDIRSVTRASLRAALALVSQDVVLFNDTVRANIAYGRLDADDAAIRAAAAAAAAHEFITALPDGYDTSVGDRGTRLSGGERQRIALARAVLRDAPILLLDEATSALDADSERRVQAALARLAVNRTTLVIAHRLATVRQADHVVVLQDGGIVEQGDHDGLMAAGGLYARLCRMQYFVGD